MNHRALRLPAVFAFGIYLVYAALLVPLNQVVAADAVLSATLLWDAIDLCMNWGEILGMAVMIGFLIHTVAREGVRASRPLYFLCGGALLFKYAVSLLALFIVSGSVDLTMDFAGYLVSLLLELLEAAAAVLLAARLPRGNDPIFPFRGLFSRSNPLQRAAFWSLVLLCGVRLVSYLVGDLAFLAFGAGYTPADIPLTLLYWLLLIFLPAFLGYLAALGCMRLGEHARAKDAPPAESVPGDTTH